MQKILSALKDIHGVVGSFVLAGDGRLLGREMPALYPDSIFPDMGRRLSSVSEAMETQRGPYAELLLKFDAYWLLSRRTATCTLNILTTDSVNYPALRMATNVAMKQVDEQVAKAPVPPAFVEPEAELNPVATVAVSPAVAPLPVVPPPAEPVRARRVWRGQVMD